MSWLNPEQKRSPALKSPRQRLFLPPIASMDAFEPTPPQWTSQAIHAHQFCCPTCRSSSREATKVWINRRSPVFTEDHRRKWQEFYACHCGTVWWAWSNDRPPSEFVTRESDLREDE